jgi:hypothetical protein
MCHGNTSGLTMNHKSTMIWQEILETWVEFWPYQEAVNLKLGQSDVTSPANFLCLLHRVCIFQLYLEFVWRNSIFLVKSLLIYDSLSIPKCSHGTFVTFIQENGVPRGKLQLLGFFNYNFWHKMKVKTPLMSQVLLVSGHKTIKLSNR